MSQENVEFCITYAMYAGTQCIEGRYERATKATTPLEIFGVNYQPRIDWKHISLSSGLVFLSYEQAKRRVKPAGTLEYHVVDEKLLETPIGEIKGFQSHERPHIRIYAF